MKAYCEKLGGLFVVILSVGLITGTMLLIHGGKCAADIGFGFITAALLPIALGRQHHRRCQELQNQIAATKSDVRTSVAAHANDVRQHVTQLADLTSRKIDGLAGDLRQSKPQGPKSKVRGTKK